MTGKFERHFLEEALAELRKYKKLGEKALEQLENQQFFVTIDPQSNNIAIIVKHLAGNMRSRWVDFLTTDGEKPDRNRDQEFIIDSNTTREDVMK